MARKLIILKWDGKAYQEIFTHENTLIDSLSLSLTDLGDCNIYIDEMPKSAEPVKEICTHVFPINGGECLKCGESKQ